MEMKQRRSRLSTLAVAYTLAVLAGLVALSVLTARRSLRVDLTEARRHTLGDATMAVLASIPESPEPVDIVAVTSAIVAGGNAREAESQVRPLLELLAHASPRVRVSVRFAENEPALVEKLAIDRVPVVLVHWRPPAPAEGGVRPEARERRTLLATEAGVAAALRDVLENRKRVAYALLGHGEMRLADTGAAGLGLLQATLESLNFEVRELALAGSADVPPDTDVLILAGPQEDLFPAEMEALDRLAARGGRILVLDGPTREPARLQLLHSWLAGRWNVGPSEGVVADFDVPLGADPRILLVMPSQDEPHAIVAGLRKTLQLPLSRGLVYLDQAMEGVAASQALVSGPRSWLETDLSAPEPRYDDGVDPKGPHALAWAVTRKPAGQAEEARLVVFGTRMAFANQYLGSGGNMDLLRNAVDWVTGREDDIRARQGSGEDGSVIISERQGGIIIASTLVLPIIVALTGIVHWWRRRKL